ncbi:hypothetical protein V6N13_122618 [Hibiscus sabdariffa]|uniref:Uncharacterized protein n=1 Tax=Hibiscus sabdariffa TaxID=183260 RepID=A0ABR2B5R1_9ROSI
MTGCLAAEVGADRGSNERRVAPSHRGSLGSQNNAGKRGLASMGGLSWTAQVTGVDLGGRGDLRRRKIHHKPTLGRGITTMATTTESASCVRRTVLGESQPATTGMTTT